MRFWLERPDRAAKTYGWKGPQSKQGNMTETPEFGLCELGMEGRGGG